MWPLPATQVTLTIRNPMKIDELIFVGLNGYAVALARDTGEIVWSNNEMRSGYVTLLLDGDRLIEVEMPDGIHIVGQAAQRL